MYQTYFKRFLYTHTFKEEEKPAIIIKLKTNKSLFFYYFIGIYNS